MTCTGMWLRSTVTAALLMASLLFNCRVYATTPPTMPAVSPRIEALVKQPTGDALVAALRDPDAGVRSTAVLLLKYHPDPRAVGSLVDMLHGFDLPLRERAAAALVAIGPAAVEAVIPQLRANEARKLLGTNPSFNSPLAIKYRDHWTEMMAAKILQEINDPRALAPAIALKDEENNWSYGEPLFDFIVSIARMHPDAFVGLLRTPGGPGWRSADSVLEQLQEDITYPSLEHVPVVTKTHDLSPYQPAVPAIIQGLHHQDFEIRRTAARLLGRLADLTAVPALIDALKDEKVRVEAIYALAALKDRRAIEPILPYLTSTDVETRSAGLAAMCVFREPRAVPALLRALKAKEGQTYQIIVTLAALRVPEALPEIIRQLDEKNVDFIRVDDSLVTALTAYGKTAVKPLIGALSSKSTMTRAIAAAALGKLGDTAAVPALRKRLHDETSTVREEAATALGKLAPAEMRALTKEKHPEIRRLALLALASVASPHDLKRLIMALHDPSVDIRYSVTWALARRHDPALISVLLVYPTYFNPNLEDPERLAGVQEDIERENFAGELACCGAAGVPTLTKALHSKAEEVQSLAVEALALIDDDAAVPSLIYALGVADLQLIACEGLSRREEVVVNRLLPVLHDPNPVRRQGILVAFGPIGNSGIPMLPVLGNAGTKRHHRVMVPLDQTRDQRVVPALSRSLHDPVVAVRETAAAALFRFGDHRALEPLLEALKDPAPSVRAMAILSLGEIGDPQVTPDLLRVLTAPASNVLLQREEEGQSFSGTFDYDGHVVLPYNLRAAAVKALGAIGDPRAVQALASVMVQDGKLRMEAEFALAQIGTPSVEALLAVLQHEDPDVRADAVNALAQIGDPRAKPALLAERSRAIPPEDIDYALTQFSP